MAKPLKSLEETYESLRTLAQRHDELISNYGTNNRDECKKFSKYFHESTWRANDFLSIDKVMALEILEDHCQRFSGINCGFYSSLLFGTSKETCKRFSEALLNIINYNNSARYPNKK